MKTIKESMAILMGAVLCYFLGQLTNPVFSASIIGLIAGIFFHSLSIPLYIGAFVGMSSELIMPNIFFLVEASLISSFLWAILMKKIPSWGGKAGFTAFLGVLTTVVINGWEHEQVTKSLNPEIIFLLILTSMFATIMTFEIRKKIREQGNAVIGSATIGFSFGAFSLLFPETTIFSEVAFAASFAGMTDLKHIQEQWHTLIVGFVVGVVFLLLTSSFSGFGGKLGTIAFISVLLCINIFKKIK